MNFLFDIKLSSCFYKVQISTNIYILSVIREITYIKKGTKMYNFRIKSGMCKKSITYPVRRGFVPSFVNYKKECTRLAAASDKVYQLLAQGRWFSPASSITKTGRHDIAEILLKVVLNTKNSKIQKINFN